MYEVEVFKDELDSSCRISFCQACLSSDRNLIPIDQDHYDIFKNILEKTLPQPILICWECMAIVKKIKCFKTKLQEAQRILTYHYATKQRSLLKSLTKLTKTYSDHTVDIIYNEDEQEYKEKIEIKVENQSDENYNYEQNNDLCLNQEIKKEETIDTGRTVKRNKTLHYRIVYEQNSKKDLRKKFAIKPEELDLWLENERKSDFYKKFKYKCKLCMNGYKIKEKLKSHILKRHDKSTAQYKCETCNTHFDNETALNNHARSHMFAWECMKCGFQCYSARRLNSHINSHRTVQCVYCEAEFQDVSSFYVHYKSLHSVFLCDHCGKRCKTKYMLEKHMSRHADTHICSTCSRKYKSRAALRKHYALKHAPCTAEQAYCVLCDKQYASEYVYRRHVHTSVAHTREREIQVKKKYPCPDCSNTYSRRAYMMNHYRHVHMNQSKYYCSTCERHFLNRTRYIDHMRYNHEGVKKEKNKLCNICGRGFAANRTLLNHMRTHSGERPYECEYCSSKFTQRTSMLSHIKYIHLKSKRGQEWTQ